MQHVFLVYCDSLSGDINAVQTKEVEEEIIDAPFIKLDSVTAGGVTVLSVTHCYSVTPHG